MFTVSGAWGILCIGLFGAYFVSRYFEQNPKIEPGLLISLLAVFGLGPAGLLLVQNYLQGQLLDPYGIGVLLGAAANLVLRIAGATLSRYSIARALSTFSSTQ